MLKRLAFGIVLAAAIGAAASAQTRFVTPAGGQAENAPGAVVMCLNGSSQAVPCDASTPLQVTGSSNASVGANGAAVKTSSTLVGVSDGTNQQQVVAPISLTDGVNGNNMVSSGGYVWNGTTWDRARQIPLGITPTDRTITSASGASQQIMAANASRHSLTIQNTGNANCGVNPTGGTAAIGGAGTLTLVPNGSYTPRVPTLSAVTVICTAAQPIYASEN